MWRCLCDCGNYTNVLTTNLGKTTRCRHCSRRKDITGERNGLLVAECCETGPVRGREPLWTFRCDCGNSVRGTVREFHAQWLRSCGCHDSTYGSWTSMMSRCYNEKDIRYKHYGARGIVVCSRWHNFLNFALDMGERPRRHNLSRKRCEKGYYPSNCKWEHVSKNGPDTHEGVPTKQGLKKGAKPRS